MTTPTGPAKPRRATEALIYIPGLALGFAADKTPRGVIDRVTRAMDAHAVGTATFSVEWQEAIFGEGSSDKPAATILRTDGEETRPVVDVYVNEWATRFKDRWEKQNLFVRAGRTLLGLLGFPKFIRFFRTSGKRTPFGRMQLALALVAVAVVAAYAAILVLAFGQLVYQTIQEQQPPAAGTPPVMETTTTDGSSSKASDDSKSDGDTMAALTLTQWLAILGAAGAALVPKVRDRVNTLGATLSAASSYLRVARDQPVIVGRLESTVAKLNDRGQYDHVRLVGYSFGSIVALDTLFPTTGDPPPSLDTVDKLVTIGCPYEFALAMRPNWLSGRCSRENVPATWLNIYSPVDLLGSDFSVTGKQDADKPASIEIVPGATASAVRPTTNHNWNLGIQPTWGNLVEFYGFNSHGMYWGVDNESDDRNVFVEAVRHLYGGTPILD